jgi:hypothetical protein
VPLGLSLQGIRGFPFNTVMQTIEFVFASEQSDCSRATAYSEMIPHRKLVPDSASYTGLSKYGNLTNQARGPHPDKSCQDMADLQCYISRMMLEFPSKFLSQGRAKSCPKATSG